MTIATLTRTHTFPPCTRADEIRASIPKLHCLRCDQWKHWSNPTDDMCDGCQQGNPIAIMGNSHGVPWRRNSQGVPN